NEIIPSDAFYFFLHDEEKQLLRLPVHLNKIKYGSREKDDFTLSYPDTKLATLLSTNQPLIRYQKDDRLVYSSEELKIWGTDICVDMSVPIFGHTGKLIGVLNFACEEKQNFNRFQRSVAMTTAGLLGKVIERDYYIEKLNKQQGINAWWEESFKKVLENTSLPTSLLDLSKDLLIAPNAAFRTFFHIGDALGDSVCVSSVLGSTFLENLRNQAIPDSGKRLLYKNKNGRKYWLRLLPLGEPSQFVLLTVSSFKNKNRNRRLLLNWSAKLTDILSRSRPEPVNENYHKNLESILDDLGQLFDAQFVTFCSVGHKVVKLEYARSFLKKGESTAFHQLLDTICQQTCSKMLAFPESQIVRLEENPLLIENILPVVKQLDIRDVLIIPLTDTPENKRVIVFYYQRKVQLASFKMKMIRNAALQLHYFIANKGLSERVEKQDKFQQWMLDITGQINSNTDTHVYLDKILTNLREIIHFDVVCITLFDAQKLGEQRFLTASERFQELVQPDRWQDFLSSANDKKFNNVKARKDLGGFADLKSTLQDYIVLADKCIGVIELGHLDTSAYSTIDETIVKGLVQHIATILRGIQSFRKAKSKVNEIAQILHRSIVGPDWQQNRDILEKMLDDSQHVLSASETMLFLNDQSIDAVGNSRLSKVVALLPDFDEKLKIKKESYTIQQLESISKDRHFYGTCVFIPIVFDGETRAVLGILWNEQYTITRWDNEILLVLATLIANVLRIAKIYKLKNEQSDRLIRANTELENFVYTVSHDLKSPVVSIQGFSSILIDEYGHLLDDDGRHYLDRVHKNAVQMEQLLRALLELSRIDRSRIKLSLVDGNVPVERALVEFSFQLQSKHIRISVQENLPRIYCDVVRITQVFSNLIGNAIKFRDKNKDETRINIGAEMGGEFVTFFVEDNGIGIPEHHLKSVFTMFMRHNRYHGIDGNGIGLTIAKRIVENHNGRIWMESEEGVGTKIFFTLPVQNSAAVTGG
ncbi:MAG: GHKL domain-containing protein, partial [Calditrichaeota bacterium]